MFIQRTGGGMLARKVAERLIGGFAPEGGVVEQAFVRADQVEGKSLYRVRVGPIPSVNEFDRVLARLRSLGLTDAQLAAD